MKKWCLIFIVLLILPVVSASMDLTGSSLKEVYNLGEEIVANVNIKDLNENVYGLIKLDLVCGESSSSLLTEVISIPQGESKNIQKNLPIIPFITGLCHITASLEKLPEGTLMEQATSKEFTITKDIDSTISIDNNLVQLGKTVKISGSIFKKDGTNINGIATIYFNQGATTYLVDSVNIQNGEFNYIFDTSSKPAGVYNIEIHATDIYSNSNIFSDLSITLTSDIVVTAHSSDMEALPGETIKITGEAVDISQEPLKSADVLIKVGDEEFLTTLSKGDFSEKITIPKNIKSGKQQIIVIVEDEQGNRGESEIPIEIKPIQTKLDIALSQEDYDPSADITIKPLLYDQANDLIIEDISVKIYNPKGRLEFNEVVGTNENLIYTLGQYSLPGTWKIILSSSKTDYEKTFLVNEIFLLHFELYNQTLSIINRGNVKYILPLKIELDGPQRINIVKKLNLNPKDSYDIDLGIGIPTGTYNVIVQDTEFRDVYITGKKQPFDWDFIYYIFIAIVVLAFLYWLLKQVFRKKHRRKPREVKEQPKEEFKEDYKKEYINRLRKKVEEREAKTKEELKKLTFKKPEKGFSQEAGYIQIKAPKSEPTFYRQTPSEKPLWKILRKKGLAEPKGPVTKKPGLFSMFD